MFTRKDIWIFPAGLLVAFLMVWPHFFIVARDAGYRGVPFFRDDDGMYYVARVHEVTDGHPFLGNPYLAEKKDAPPMQFFVPDWIAALPAIITGADPALAVLWSTFLWVPLLFALFYFAVRDLTRSRLWAGLAAVGLFFGPLLGLWNRPVSPQTTAPVWLALLWVLARTMSGAEKEKGTSAAPRMPQHWKAWATLAFGSLFYLYPYGWTFYATALVLFASAAWKWKLGVRMRDVLLVVAGGFALGVPVFIYNGLAARLSEYGESLTRLGMIATHMPSGVKIVVPMLFLVLAAFALSRSGFMQRGARWWLVVCGLFAVSIAVNQHVVTGWNLEFSSHYSDTALLWGAITIAFFAAEMERALASERARRALIVLSMLAVAVFLAVDAPKRWAEGVRRAEVVRNEQRLGDGVALVRTHAAKDDVVLASPALSVLIPALTTANVYFDRHANLFYITNEEVRDRYLAANFFEPLTPERLRADERALWGVRYIDQVGKVRQENKVRRLLGRMERALPTLPVSEVSATLARSTELHAEGFESALKRYQADWVLWDRAANPSWEPMAEMPWLERVGEEGDFVLFRVR